LSLISLFLTLFTGPAYPRDYLDFGGSVKAMTGFEHDGNDGVFLLEDTLTLWFSAHRGEFFSLTVQGSMVNNLDRPYLLDLDIAKLSWRFAREPEPDAATVVEAGRFLFSDFSGQVLSHKADGIRVEWGFPFTNISAAVAYTGFQVKPNSTILLSQSDAQEAVDDDVYYGSPRLVEVLTLRVPDGLFGQDFALGLAAQQDLRSYDSDSGDADDRVNTFYVGLGTSGSVFSTLYLDLFGYLGFGTVGESRVFSGMYGAGLRYFYREFYNSRFEGRFLYAGGEENGIGFYKAPADGESNQFYPISKRDTGIVFSPRPSNITLVELGYSLKPLPSVQAGVQCFLFWRSVAGPISEGGIDPADTTDRFLGTEFDITATWKLRSDVGFSFGFGTFFPAAGSGGAFLDAAPRFKGTIDAVLSF
jgi:hypothetical protein